MPGNSFGKNFKITTWGESHGKAIGVVIDGCPPLLPLDESDIQKELDRRKPRGRPGSTTRSEEDKVHILSGTFNGKTTGTPIQLIIYNKDAKGKAYEDIKDIFRPGHADFTYFKKYGIRDYRGGGRASGRETAARVGAGAVARKILTQEGIVVRAYTIELAGVRVSKIDLDQVDKNPFYTPDSGAAREMEERITEIKNMGDSAGGIVEIIVTGCPAGLGEPVFDKLDADLSKAVMSIGAVKGVEIGAGFESARMLGSVCNDEMTPGGFLTNHSGGILGGISNGDTIVMRAAIKPIPSIEKKQRSVDIYNRERTISVKGRHDVSAVPRIVPVCEAMVCLVLTDHLLRQRSVTSNLKL
nr:chorismate synthase [Desulfobacterales bacterium]